MPMRSSNWAELLLPTIYNFYDIGRMLRPELRPQIFNIQTMSGTLATVAFHRMPGTATKLAALRAVLTSIRATPPPTPTMSTSSPSK